MDKILIICGPTATGKTKLALKLAKLFNGELVSADSRQIYREMDIGTGKDLPDNRTTGPELMISYQKQDYLIKSYLVNDIPLWMYDVVDPDQDFSVSHFQVIASHVIQNILSRKKLPIVVGGTGFYIKSLLNPPETISISQDIKIRNELQALSVIDMQKILKKLNPEFWDKMNYSDRQNPRRLVRRIEIDKFLQKSVKSNQINHLQIQSYVIGLKATDEYLNRLITCRIEARFSQGIIPEIQYLLDIGMDWNLISMSSLGYVEWKPYFFHVIADKDSLIHQCMNTWQKNEIDYAKRQLTWFKKQPGIHWIDIQSDNWLQILKKTLVKWYNN
jgi:tRNA dimethylallyltransferase